MLLIFNKKFTFIIIILIIFLSFNVVNAEDSSIFISTNGSDINGDGSINNPYASIDHAISFNDDNNLNISIFEGTYTGSDNTNIVIDKKNITITGLGNVIIDGSGINSFFKINKNSSLTLNNINFVNGNGNVDNQLSPFYNSAYLKMENVSIKNTDSFIGTIFNEGNCYLNNVISERLYSKNYGDFLTNIANGTILNSDIGAIYNNHNIVINNSKSQSLVANKQYMNNTIHISVYNSDFSDFDVEYANVTANKLKFSNSNYLGSLKLRYSNSVFNNSVFGNNLVVSYTNLTAISSIFNYNIHNIMANTTINYSILNTVSGDYASKFNLDYNWWLSNNKPTLQYSKYLPENWIVMTFTASNNPILVGDNSTFTVSLKLTDGDYLRNISNINLLPIRKVSFESFNGEFLDKSAYLVNGTFSTKLINNNKDCEVFAIVDNQRMKLLVGSGFSNYTWYVSPKGHDGFGDGSYNNPFKTLSYVISKAISGNTIYLLNGTFTNNYNSNLIINKNLTLIGLGNVTLSRENDKNIFRIQEWGSLNIKNINFTVNYQVFTDSLFVISGGFLSIENSHFYNINSPAIIYSSSGVQSVGNVILNNISVKNVNAVVFSGVANLNVSNSYFADINPYYSIRVYMDYNYIFLPYSNLLIYNSTFYKNNVGIVNVKPITLSTSKMETKESIRFINISKSTFKENYWFDTDSDKYGFKLYDISICDSLIDGCVFIKNNGYLVKANKINNSSFIENDNGLCKVSTVNNSYFYKNINLDSDYGGSFKGNGVLEADIVLNSVFISNQAAYGGAVYNAKTVHYSVFYLNKAKYKGNDIFSYSGDVDYSSNWWGTNQKPNNEKVYLFLGTLTLNDWIIMSFNDLFNGSAKVALDTLTNDNNQLIKFNYTIPIRTATVVSNNTNLSFNKISIINNVGYVNYLKNSSNEDFTINATIDGQTLNLNVYNNATVINIEDAVFYGNNNLYKISLTNVNGHKISNQTLIVKITDSKDKTFSFILLTDENGYTKFKVDYPIGLYKIEVIYQGNGYFENSSNTKYINILISKSYLISYNFTFYGKKNIFYATLTDINGQGIVNETINFKIFNSKGESKEISILTNYKGIAEFELTLNLGDYTIVSQYLGNNWFANSSFKSYVKILPANSTFILNNVTFYGSGNEYNITLKDEYGNAIKGETFNLIISQGTKVDKYNLKTDENGKASIIINYLPGEYKLKVFFDGDNIYGSAEANAIIKIEKVYTIINAYHHITIPLNGVYSVILIDMYGKRIINQNVTLGIYKGTLLKSINVLTDGYGEANFKLDLPEGVYLATLDYNGNEFYTSSSSAATIVINASTSPGSVYINASNFIQYYGENNYFVIDFNDTNAFNLLGKIITVTISNDNFKQSYKTSSDIFGKARIQITLNPGKYNISYSYFNEYYGLYAEGSNFIEVYDMPSFIYGSNEIVKVGESKYYEITLKDINNKPIKNLNVNINLNNKNYSLNTNDEGIVKILLDFKNTGNYPITYSFENPNYISSNGSSMIVVVDSDKISTDLNGKDLNVLDNESANFTITLTDISSKGISFNDILINVTSSSGKYLGTYKASTNSDGTAVFKLDLDYGNYIIKSYYKGSNQYLPSFAINYINVDLSGNKTKTVLHYEKNSIRFNENFVVVLSDINSNVLANKTIEFKIGNNTFYSQTDDYGRCILNETFDSGLYQVQINFAGDENYGRSSLNLILTVSGSVNKILSNDIVLYYRNGTRFYTQLLDGNNNPLVNKTVYFVVMDVTYDYRTDENGIVSLSINLAPGTYSILSYYLGNSSEDYCSALNNITVLSTVLSDDLVKIYKNESQYYAKFTDGNGSPLKDTKVIFNIDGVFYYRTTDSDGYVSLNINLRPGEYVITALNTFNSQLHSNKIIVLSSIQGNNIVMYFKNGTSYEAKFLDSKGNPLKFTEVTFNIDGVFYKRTTDFNGIARLTINLRPGNYIITAINPVNGQMFSNNVTVLPVIISKDIKMHYKDGSKFEVTILDGKGKALANQNVRFNIDGTFYYRTSDSSGIAYLDINLRPGNFIITTESVGSVTSNKIVINK